MERGTSYRRFQDRKAKLKAKIYLKRASIDTSNCISEDPKYVGRFASTHCKPCSCNMCCNPRNSSFGNNKDRLTLQERKANIEDFD